MASPLFRRQISFPPAFTTTILNNPSTPTTTSTGAGNSPPQPLTSATSSVSSHSNSSILPQSTSSPPQPASAPFSSIIPSISTVSSPSPTPAPPPSTSGSNSPVTVTETTSTAVPPPSGTFGAKGKTFLENKPLAGFVFGLAGLAVLVILVIGVTSYARKRHQKRLLADASNFSFDPKHIEDRMTDEEKKPRFGLIGSHDSGYGHNDYTSDNRTAGGFSGVGLGGVSKPGPTPPPTLAYVPQDYAGHGGAYAAQYHNPSNIPVGYNPTPNPYDMYSLRNNGRYSNGQSQYDPFNTSGLSGDRPPVTDSGLPVPRQLQPGLHPAQGPTFAPQFSTSPPLNLSPPIPSTASPASLQPSAPDQHTIQRLPTPGALPDTFGERNSVDDDAYGGAFLGHSPPVQRTLQVANM